MSTATAPREVTVTVPQAPTELVSVGWVAENYHITTKAVLAAIKAGRLPALPITRGRGGVCAWAIKPADAYPLWAGRLMQTAATS